MNKQAYKSIRTKYLILAAALLIVVMMGVAAYVISSKQTKESAVVEPTRTVSLSTFHPTYASLAELVAASDTSFAGQAVVLDEGVARSERFENDPPQAPPQVHTDFKLKVKSVVKGEGVPSEITVAMMGGTVDDTRYVYEGSVPKLKKGDVVMVFAFLGNDGKYYPLSGSTAVAVQRGDGRFTLTKDTINTGEITFTEADLKK